MLTNRDIADIFEKCANLLQLKGESIHRYLAYQRAAETIRELPRDLRAISAEKGLVDLPNIGKTLAEKIDEMLTTGKLAFYEKLTAEIPVGLIDIMNINGVGPKKAMLFYQELGITTVEALKSAAAAGKLRDLPGMGAKSEQKVLEGIASLSRHTGRISIGIALPSAQAILDELLRLPNVLEGALAGSIRRGKPTIGDIDILIAVADMAHAPAIMDYFVAMPIVARILGHGETKSSIELQNGLQADLRVLVKQKWGTALNYFSGSKEHNVRMRQLALAKGLSLNEHAFSPVDADGNILEDAPKIYCDTEEAVYAQVGLPFIPPELREDAGEIEAAQRGELPNLITLNDIKGDLHMHTTYSDGVASIQQMAEEAYARGRQYIVITDHSRSLGIANGLSIERLLAQQAEVRHVDALMYGKIRVFHGTEMDINADGSLDYPDDVLAKLDFVIASLHVSLRQDRDKITQRLLNAIQNPHVDMIGHLTARYIPDREPVDADMDVVFDSVKAHGKVLEINANPRRLDIDASYVRRAVDMGILLAINTDAHQPSHLDLMPYGVMTARRGWAEARHVLNTYPTDEFIKWMESKR
ncbi:MAG: DNA polymerase/3'-5' exonuclease PolX [Phototrophicales bacterium]|nr:MAG: DNA polymerase/3'-5' exonuclease PolX [Phototrophicales bacterium]